MAQQEIVFQKMNGIEDIFVHPLILVSKTAHHERTKLTDCRKIDTIMVCDGFRNYPDKVVTYNVYTHNHIIPN